MPSTESTNPRIDYGAFQDIVPEMGTGMAAISHALRKSGIEPDLLESSRSAFRNSMVALSAFNIISTTLVSSTSRSQARSPRRLA